MEREMPEDSIALLLTQIDGARAELRALLRGLPEQAITQRPPSGKWSVLENVRHLLFAKQAHIAKLLRERPAWSPLGFTPESMRATRKLPEITADGPGIDGVWAAWDDVHQGTVRRVNAARPPETERALTRHLKHLQAHQLVIERLVRQRSK
ncbi:MAG: DinB family protein [Dehalococcoidia bacterium]|nr:MAG: DinB family protein [Dehalococcoidia bacterium]